MARRGGGFVSHLIFGPREKRGLTVRYRCYGLTIDSSMDVPGGVSIRDDAPLGNTIAADAEICFENTELDDPERVKVPYQQRADQILFDAPNVGRYLAIAGRRLHVSPHPQSHSDDVGALLVATALPMLMWMRGGLVLHSGAVIMAGNTSAVAIAGASGSGKSSLIDALMNRGARLVGDDTLSVTREANMLTIAGLAGGYFRREPGSETRHFVAVGAEHSADAAKLAALVVFDQNASADAPPLRRLAGVEAVEWVLRNRHRPKIPSLLRRDIDVFDLCRLLSQCCPIYALGRESRSVEELADVVASLDAHIQKGDRCV